MPSGESFTFGAFRLDVASRRLFKHDLPLQVQSRQFDLLHVLLQRAGTLVTKNELIALVWKGTAVEDNTLARAMMQLRAVIDDEGRASHVETVERHGYRFVTMVTRSAGGEGVADIEMLLEPYRVWSDGRAAIETLALTEIERARRELTPLVSAHPNDARFRVALGMACILSYEATRVDEQPDVVALGDASTHAERACQLDPRNAEAWATLGLVRERLGSRVDALAAHERAVSLEPDNWRHWVRLAYASWGEARLRAARRALELSPESPIALWLMASVYVARGALDLAERTIDRAIAAMSGEGPGASRLSPVAVYWLKGLLLFARGADDEARVAFERELALEARGHLYAREIASNTCYALGALALAGGNESRARHWFEQALARVPRHAMARVGLAIIEFTHGRAGGAMGAWSMEVPEEAPGQPEPPIEAAFALAALFASRGGQVIEQAASVIAEALSTRSPGSAGWLLPVEPLLRVQGHVQSWSGALTRLRERAV